jgi:hypothetical protein
MSFDLKSAISSIAPTLATMLGGPLAGTAVTALEGVFGLTPEKGGLAGVTAAVAAGLTPDQIAAVRKADQDHEAIMGQQGIDLVKVNNDFAAALAKTDADDRDSARKHDIARGGWTVPAMGWLIVSASLALTAAVVTGNVSKDPALATLIGTALGTLWAERKQIISFYFGSSAGSQAKDATIAAQVKAQ